MKCKTCERELVSVLEGGGHEECGCPDYTESDDSLICPYCEHEYDEPFRLVGNDETDIKCDGCGKTFGAEMEVWGVTYTAWAKKSELLSSDETKEKAT